MLQSLLKCAGGCIFSALALTGCTEATGIEYRPAIDPPIGYVASNVKIKSYPLKQRVPNKVSCIPIFSNDTYMRIAVGCPLDGFDMTEVHGSGQVSHIYSVRTHDVPFNESWREAKFDVGRKAAEKLFNDMMATGFHRFRMLKSDFKDAPIMIVIVGDATCETKCVFDGHLSLDAIRVYEAMRAHIYDGNLQIVGAGSRIEFPVSNRTLGTITK